MHKKYLLSWCGPDLPYDLPYKFSKPRPLSYWNSGKSRYVPHPISIFASLHKNSSNGLFSIVRQNSACSDFKQPSYTESGLDQKKRVGSGGGGGEQVDSGKADIAAHFPSVCKNVKPKTVSVGKNGNHKGARQARLPAFPHMHPHCKEKFTFGWAGKMEPSARRTQN